MGDAGEGLIDADARIQERMEELERERARKLARTVRHPELVGSLESLRLARSELAQQLVATTHERRRTQIQQALAEIERQMAATSAKMTV